MPAVDGWFSTEASKAMLYQRFCKRCVDLVFRAIALIVLLPLLFVIGGFVRAKLSPDIRVFTAHRGSNECLRHTRVCR